MSLKCDNCGAPMVLVDGKDYFFCDYCYSFNFPESSFDDGAKLLDDKGETECPVCSDFLTPASVDGVKTLYCENCRGILLKQRSFSKIVELKRNSYSGKAIKRGKIHQKELNRVLKCPECKSQMLTHPYYGPGGVVIDNCVECYLIWLDKGELSTIEKAIK
jgi:Zn-finger nucleic acid-binding protein